MRKSQGDKLRSIPIRLLFNEPELNFRADYSLFDRQSGRPLCVGNGETCKRLGKDGIQSLPCPSPDACPLAKGNACKPYGRLNVVIGDDDPLGSFVFRTTGFNSIRTLAARLQYYRALSGNRLACLPLELRLRGKSTRQSHGTPIFYVDITLRSGMGLEAALFAARQLDEERQAAGFDQAALDSAARQGLGNGAFEDGEEDNGHQRRVLPAPGRFTAPGGHGGDGQPHPGRQAGSPGAATRHPAIPPRTQAHAPARRTYMTPGAIP